MAILPHPSQLTGQTFLYHRRSSPDKIVNLGAKISWQLEQNERHPLPLPLPELMPLLPLPTEALLGDPSTSRRRSDLGARADVTQQVRETFFCSLV